MHSVILLSYWQETVAKSDSGSMICVYVKVMSLWEGNMRRPTLEVNEKRRTTG